VLAKTSFYIRRATTYGGRNLLELGIRLERCLKQRIFGLLVGGVSGQAIDPASLDLSRCRRVLLVRVNFRMGNLLLLTPALGALRQALPHARIDVLCYDAFAALLAHHPDVDHVLGVHRRMLFNPWKLARLVRTLRRAQYDLVVEGARGGSFLGAFLAAASGGRRRAAAAESRYQGFFNVRVPRRPDVEHKVDLLLAFLADLGIPPATRALKVVLTDAERAAAGARWRELGLARGGPTIGIIVGARRRKQLPPQQLVELIRRLQLRPGLAVVLFAGPEEREEEMKLRRDLAGAVVVAPQLGVRDFAALLSWCTLVVTGDTGPMHLAAAVGTPTVAVFHNTDAACYAPRGPLHRAVQASAQDTIGRVLGAVEDILAQGDRGGFGPDAVPAGPVHPPMPASARRAPAPGS
jgi:lipopolysaccharide heptosyltransferase III